MNKTIKLVSILLISLVLIAVLGQVCLATNYSQMITDVNTQITSNETATAVDSGMNNIKVSAGKVVRMIRNAAAIAAVVIISILGIKYMMGSTQEKADYKKSFIPLIVGIVVVVAASSIATLIFSVA